MPITFKVWHVFGLSRGGLLGVIHMHLVVHGQHGAGFISGDFIAPAYPRATTREALKTKVANSSNSKPGEEFRCRAARPAYIHGSQRSLEPSISWLTNSSIIVFFGQNFRDDSLRPSNSVIPPHFSERTLTLRRLSYEICNDHRCISRTDVSYL